MRPDRLAPLGLGVLAAAMVIAGLMVVGGPEAARREKRDEARAGDISSLARCLRDLPQAELDALPNEMTAGTACADSVTWKDAATGEPFRIESDGSGHYRVCATFESPKKIRHVFYGQAFDPETGCVKDERAG